MNTVFQTVPLLRHKVAPGLIRMSALGSSRAIFGMLLLAALSACGGGGGGSGDAVPREPVELDTDFDGLLDSVDIDDDGDGLIEIATLVELDGIRRNLAGTAIVDEQGVETTSGCPETGCFGYELTADIDFSVGDTNWLPLGHARAAAPFTADFNGNGHTLRNLSIDRTRADIELTSGVQLGLFGRVQGRPERPAQISNLKLEGSVSGAGELGLLLGTGEFVHLNNVVVAGEVTLIGGASLIDSAFLGGGIAGSIKFSQLDRAQFNGSITVANSKQPDSALPGTALDVGGLCGVARHSDISASVFTGQVMARGLRSGGLVGSLLQESSIAESVAMGIVQGGEAVGGIAGAAAESSVSDVLSSIAIQGADQLGGAVGHDRSNHYHALVLTPAFQADVPIDSGGLIAGRSEDSSFDATYALVSPFMASLFGNLLTSIEQSADRLQGWSRAQLQCAELADTEQCDGSASYAGFSAVWDFGNPEQLPGLFISDQLYRDNDLDQRKDS